MPSLPQPNPLKMGINSQCDATLFICTAKVAPTRGATLEYTTKREAEAEAKQEQKEKDQAESK